MDKGYAWVVMAATCLLQILYSCLLTSFGIFLVDITETTEFSTGKVAWIGALGATFCGVSGAVTGNFIDKFGCRIVVVVGSLMISSGYLISAFVRDVRIQYFSLGILAGIGFNCYAVSSHVAASQWFKKRKSLALSIVMFGMSFGIFIWGPLARFLSSTYAWRGAMFLIAGIQLNGLVIALLLRPPPEKHEPEIEPNKKVQEGKKPNFRLCDFSLCTDWLFMVYCIANFCLLFGHVLPLTLLPTKAKTVKIDKDRGALFVSMMGACSAVGRPIVGYCADKPWFNRRLMFASSSLIGGILSAVSTLLNTFVLLMVYSALIGFFSAFFMALFASVGSDLVGLANMPKAVGLLTTAHGFSFLLSIAISGQLCDYTGNTDASFLLAGTIQTISGILAFIVYIIHKRRLNQKDSKMNTVLDEKV